MSSRWLCSSSWNSFSGVRCSLCKRADELQHVLVGDDVGRRGRQPAEQVVDDRALQLVALGGRSATPLRGRRRGGPARRSAITSAAGRLPFARPLSSPTYVVSNEDTLGVHVCLAKRAPDAGKTISRAGAQPPPPHRQQLLELAGAAVSPNRQRRRLSNAAMSARCVTDSQSSQDQPLPCFSATGNSAHAGVYRRREIYSQAACAVR